MSTVDFPALLPWISAIGGGLLIGIERERSQPPESPAGMRSFLLAALAGAIAARFGGGVLAVALAGVAGLALFAYAQTRRDDPGLTTEIALVLVVLLGALAQQSPGWAAGLSTLVAGVLAAKRSLHRLARQLLTAREVQHGLLLAAAVLIVLPLLPDRPLSALAGLNLHTLWGLAVMVMVLQSVGHIALRALGARRGLALAGLAGGFVSSTATVASMARQAVQTPVLFTHCLRGALLSSLATSVELALLVGLLLPPLLLRLWPALTLYAVGVLAATALAGRLRKDHDGTEATPPDFASQPPFHPRHAVLFAVAISVILLVADAARAWMGATGAVITAGLAGLADAHAASVSAAQLAAAGLLDLRSASIAIGLALSVNAGSKVVAGWSAANRRFGLWIGLTQAGQIALFWCGWAAANTLFS